MSRTSPVVYVVGDPIADLYIHGTATHICPEAPVPVLREEKRNISMGGCLNCAANVQAAGADVRVYTIMDHSVEAAELDRMFRCQTGHPVRGFMLESRRLQVKTRLVGQYGRQMMRVDVPKDGPLDISSTGQLVSMMQFDAGGDPAFAPDIVIVSDYGCGTVTRDLVERIVRWRDQAKSFMILVDPYPTTDPTVYRGVDIVKCNRHEYEVMYERVGPDVLRDIADRYVVTSGPNAVALLDRGSMTQMNITVPHVEVVDPCGAGDVFMAYLSVAMSLGGSIHEAVRDAIMGGCVCVQRLGTCVVDRRDVVVFARQAGYTLVTRSAECPTKC